MPLFIVATTNTKTDKALRERLVRHFPNDHYEIGRGQWLVSFRGLARGLFERIAEHDQEAIVDTVILGINGFYGYASGEIWEWIAAKSRGLNA
jgi:hypothetical protein